ncbi:MAG: preprotein translocase subunit SecG [Planctomycetota bacterium]
MEWYVVLLTIFFLVLCVAIILVVLLQPGQDDGLAGTFGSGGMLSSAFGVHAKNRLMRFTAGMVILLFVIIFAFNMIDTKDKTPGLPAIMQGTDVKPETPPAPEPVPAPAPQGAVPSQPDTAVPAAAPVPEPAPAAPPAPVN